MKKVWKMDITCYKVLRIYSLSWSMRDPYPNQSHWCRRKYDRKINYLAITTRQACRLHSHRRRLPEITFSQSQRRPVSLVQSTSYREFIIRIKECIKYQEFRVIYTSKDIVSEMYEISPPNERLLKILTWYLKSIRYIDIKNMQKRSITSNYFKVPLSNCIYDCSNHPSSR